MKKYISFLLTTLITISLFAQKTDSTFGINGKAITGFGAWNGYCNAGSLAANQKTVLVGNNGNAANAPLMVQHKADGKTDSAFGVNGIVNFSFGGSYEEALTVTHTADRILVAGVSFGSAAIAQFDTLGKIDSSFNATGIRKLNLGAGNGSRFEKIVLQPDGKILAAGYAYDGTDFDFLAVRFLPSGVPDSSFGTDGVVRQDVSTFDDFGYDIALQANEKIVIAGFSNRGIGQGTTGYNRFAAIRLNSDGSLDANFATAGRFLYDFGSSTNNQIDAVKTTPADKIILAGFSQTQMVCLQLDSNGILDNSFGSNGSSTVNIYGNEDKVYDIFLQHDGKILLGGGALTDTGVHEMAIVRLDENGNPDHSFSEDGIFTISGGTSWIRNLLTTNEDKIIAMGQTSQTLGSPAKFIATRIDPTPLSTGLSAMNKSLSHHVYPNPFSEHLVIQSSAYQQYSIADLQGKILLSGILNSETNLSLPFDSGCYLLCLSDYSGHNKIIKIVKQ